MNPEHQRTNIATIVVDDNDIDRYLVQRSLRSLGREDVEYFEFAAGDHLIHQIRQKDSIATLFADPTTLILVLLDINMPRMNGFEVLEALDELLVPENRVNVVTMYSSEVHAQDRSDQLKYDFVKDSLIKPISPESLERLLAKVATFPS